MASPALARRALRLFIRCHAIHPHPQRLIPARRTAATYTSPHQAAQISEIPTTVDPNSQTYQDNAASMSSLVEKLSHLHAQAAQGGPEKARTKHRERGKMLVRDRITALTDPGTSFMELSALAGHELYEGEEVPAGGIVTGIGTVEGTMCMIVANDSTYVSHQSKSLPAILVQTLTVRECERRYILPDHRQEAHPRPRNRPAKPSPVPLPS